MAIKKLSHDHVSTVDLDYINFILEGIGKEQEIVETKTRNIYSKIMQCDECKVRYLVYSEDIRKLPLLTEKTYLSPSVIDILKENIENIDEPFKKIVQAFEKGRTKFLSNLQGLPRLTAANVMRGDPLQEEVIELKNNFAEEGCFEVTIREEKKYRFRLDLENAVEIPLFVVILTRDNEFVGLYRVKQIDREIVSAPISLKKGNYKIYLPT